MSFEAFQHPAPTSWEVFEDLSCALFAEVWGDPTARKNGRRGDEQHGVDVCGRLPNGDWVAVQCKGKDNYAEKEVMPAELRKEVAKALTFRPQLTQWILVTSGPKRADVEALAREITEEHRAQGLFEVQAMGWDDLCHLIGRHETVIERYFPEVAPKMRRVAQQVEEMHGILTDLRGGAATITPRDLVGGVPTPPAVPTAFEGKDAERVRRILGAHSATLLAWPTTTAGEWLDRPELTGMVEHLAKPVAPPLVLLGPPGSGKSALLAKLGRELATRGTTLLAIKADALPGRVASLADLDAETGVPEPLDRCLVRLAAEGPVVLLIDQLDALADLMDQHGGRLSALLSLVALVRNHQNLGIILSSREFEFRHDARLTSLEAVPLHLGLLSWEAVEPLVRGARLNPTNWPPEFREVLCTPQHLDLFLTYLADAGTAYASYHDMLEEVFRRRILSGDSGQNDGAALHAVARAMIEEEDLWVPSARFDTHRDAIQRLQGAGFLVQDGRRIGFRHQTIFDFVRARAFVADGESVADYALARQGTIFARPTIWSAFTYLRASDPSGYERELVRLWNAQDLRPHLRWLLRDFIGKQAVPTDGEARLLLPVLADPEEGARALRSTIGSLGWFDRLLPRAVDLMRAPEPLGWAYSVLLRSVVNARYDLVLPLVTEHWTAPEFQSRAYLVLDGLNTWTDVAADLAKEIAPALDMWRVMALAQAIGKSLPRRLPDFLLCRLEVILAEGRAKGSADDTLKRFLTDPSGMYGFGALLLGSPATHVRVLWPWFAEVAALTVARYEHRDGYRHDDGSLLDRFGSRSHDHDHLGRAFANAIAAWARREPDAFVEFASNVVSTDLDALHQFLAGGYLAVAESRPLAVLDYLLGDERRFQLGSYDDPYGVTEALIAAIAPHCNRRLIPIQLSA
ncbi:ATP-binding protein [Roseomonas marmotae]|uniref:AAA family ATPase n=1 Tax=Roseomonas marmotae TaxID=2768161 RepID=UPI001AD786B3|nr:ATP-binding protein [Roseomonas marmotae]QTI80170.1 ATP-binding protein [Roseomonas marmotae]